MDAPVQVGVDKSISLKPGRQIRAGVSGQSPALIAAKDRWAAQVTPGSFCGSPGITHKSSPSHLLLICLSCCVSCILASAGFKWGLRSPPSVFPSFSTTFSPTPSESDDRGMQTPKGSLLFPSGEGRGLQREKEEGVWAPVWVGKNLRDLGGEGGHRGPTLQTFGSSVKPSSKPF